MFKVGDLVTHVVGEGTVFRITGKHERPGVWYVEGISGRYKNVKPTLSEQFFRRVSKLDKILS